MRRLATFWVSGLLWASSSLAQTSVERFKPSALTGAQLTTPSATALGEVKARRTDDEPFV